MLEVWCVWTGDKYPREYVEKLFFSVEWNLDGLHTFHVLTDHPQELEGFHRDLIVEDVRSIEGAEIAGWWAKVLLFRHHQNDMLFFDLDTIIAGSLWEIVERAKEKGCLVVLRDFYRPEEWGSGLMYLPGTAGREGKSAFEAVWKLFTKDTPKKFRGDQDWIRNVGQNNLDPRSGVVFWQDILEDLEVVSYKVHCTTEDGLPSVLPPAARVVCFHGQPKPKELVESCRWVDFLWNFRWEVNQKTRDAENQRS